MNVALFITITVCSLLSASYADGETCGAVKATTHNGDETEYGEFPWVAAIEYTMAGTNYIVGIKCGGAVIHKRFVLTAAQCLNIKNFEIHSVWLGVRKLSEIHTTDVDKAKNFGIAKKIQHEEYNPNKLTNDIALLKLDNDILFSDYISSVCLPEQSSPLPPSGTMLTISGWGQTGSCGPTTDLKLKQQLPLYSHTDCIDNWNVPTRADQICTAPESIQSSCWRDTGMPIMESRPIGINKQWFVIGVVTSNEGCRGPTPVTHTRVSSYANWITQKIHRS